MFHAFQHAAAAPPCRVRNTSPREAHNITGAASRAIRVRYSSQTMISDTPLFAGS